MARPPRPDTTDALPDARVQAESMMYLADQVGSGLAALVAAVTTVFDALEPLAKLVALALAEDDGPKPEYAGPSHKAPGNVARPGDPVNDAQRRKVAPPPISDDPGAGPCSRHGYPH